MKRLLFIIFTFVSSASYSQDLSFDNGGSKGGVSNGWHVEKTCNEATVAIDPAVSHSGHHSLNLSGMNFVVWRKFKLLHEAKSMLLSGYLKTGKLDGRIDLSVRTMSGKSIPY